jgi:septum formation protein
MLYLASQSPRRRALLSRLHRQFRIVGSTHREVIRKELSPSENAMRNAIGKALYAQLPSRAKGIVIGADTFLYFRGRVIGKPRTMREAHRFLRALSGKSHWVYTGLCLRNLQTGCMHASYEKTRVIFKPLSHQAIARLFARSSPLDKAGGYAIQEARGELIARLEGSTSNVIGLPLELLRRELSRIDCC